MSDFKVAGLASGFDWQTMVDQLMEIERIPIRRYEAEKRENSTALDALSRVGEKLGKLDSALGALNVSSLYNSKSVGLGNETLGIKATASTSATEGSYSIAVSKLASATKRFGDADVGGNVGDENTVLTNLRLAKDITAGTFQVNGQDITVSESDTLQDVFDAISTATSGVVSASYDSLTDKVTLSSSSGQLELGSDDDTSNFLSALKLDQLEMVDAGGGISEVTSKSALGVVDLDAALSSSGIAGVSGSDTFYINGVGIDFDAGVDSMSAIMARVNESGAGVTMSYDAASDQFRIVSKETGAYAMPVIDSGNGFLAALGLTGSADVGDDLEFSIDGGSLQKARGNTITSEEHGIEGLSITATETGTQSITLTRDSSGLKSKIDAFISAFNDVQDYILEKTKIENNDGEVTAGTLAGNREISSLDSQLRSLAFRSIDGLSGNIFRLEHLGIDFISGTSKLEIKDGSALSAALDGELDTLEKFFTEGDDSFVARMEGYIENFTGDDGSLELQQNTLTGRNSRIDDQIKEIERRLESQRAALEASFIAMETAQSNLNSQSAALASLNLDFN